MHVFVGAMHAQSGSQAPQVFTSPQGNYILVTETNLKQAPAKADGFEVLRRKKKAPAFEKIGSIRPIKSMSEMHSKIGEGATEDFKKFINAKSDREVITFLHTNNDISKLGVFILDASFCEAAGMAYLDKLSPEDQLMYEYRVTDVNGTVIFEQSPHPFSLPDMPELTVKRIQNTDSSVHLQWTGNKVKYHLPLFVKVYKQQDGSGKFNLLKNRLAISTEKSGSFLVQHHEQLLPERLCNYYVVPVDFVGNEGNPSDTAMVISIDPNKMQGIKNLTTHDSLGGLFITWQGLPAKPYYTGIEIMRSRSLKEGYIVLDTIPATATNYLDKQVLPGVTYYYQFRTLLYNLSSVEQFSPATVFGGIQSSPHSLLPPKNLQARNEGAHIRLSWDVSHDLDLHAYYVMRGTSTRNMVIVSDAIKDTTWLDSATVLSGRTHYVYSVISMSAAQKRSAPSESVAIRPERAGFLPVPSDVAVIVTADQAVLRWSDLRQNDAAIEGYMLYRRKKGEKDFTPVTSALFKGNYYEDTTLKQGVSYEYTVTSVDMYGYQSKPSTYVKAVLPEVKIFPPSQIYVRRVSKGVEVSWPSNNNTNIVAYKVYKRSADGKKYNLLATVKNKGVSYLDKTPAFGKLNAYKVSIVTPNYETSLSVEKALFVNK